MRIINIISKIATLWNILHYFLCFELYVIEASAQSAQSSMTKLLSLGDEALSNDNIDGAIEYYKDGVTLYENTDSDESPSITTVLSLYTNMATALAVLARADDAVNGYEKALYVYQEIINGTDAGLNDSEIADATKIAAQSAFFLGMEYQDLQRIQDAVESYTYAGQLDPLHWAAFANLGSVFYDNMKNFDLALTAYNKAYSILIDTTQTPTDPPPNSRPILGQLQYRIGLCLSTNRNRKCTLDNDPDKNLVDCAEMAAHAFSLAIEYDPDNSEAAKHMLATITADATMHRASNGYVKSLFDEYAHNFENSLVNDLKYDGYMRLRRAFDTALGGQENVPIFRTVVDAGCGTGLVGEQFRNISTTLIGVDLSEAIIQRALQSRPGLYNEVLAVDLIHVFRDRHPIDLIVAGDSYIYFGDLQPLFSSMAEGLASGGYIAFTLENVSDEDEEVLNESKPDWRWQLTASGRFAHRRDYVIQTAQELGIETILYEPMDGFRYEHGVPVRGHTFIMQKLETNDEL